MNPDAGVGHSGLDPEYRRDRFRRENVACRAVRHEPSAIHHQHAVGEARRQREIVQDCQHGRPAVRHLCQQLHDDELMARIERHGRLVGEQDRCLRGERPRQRYARALAA